MLSEREDRWIIKCNECPVRMDIAPARMPKEHIRMPSGWVDIGDNAHVCPQCSPRWMPAQAAGRGAGARVSWR
jgi:hypothetical protein